MSTPVHYKTYMIMFLRATQDLDIWFCVKKEDVEHINNICT